MDVITRDRKLYLLGSNFCSSKVTVTVSSYFFKTATVTSLLFFQVTVTATKLLLESNVPTTALSDSKTEILNQLQFNCLFCEKFRSRSTHATIRLI